MGDIYGQIAAQMSREALGERLREGLWRVDVGPYVVRLMNDRVQVVFASDGDGFILDDVMGAEGDLIEGARQVSNYLTARGLRHRFEIYENELLLIYLHYDWPLAPVEAL